jgi:uncharacterized protein (TIGR00288 family)
MSNPERVMLLIDADNVSIDIMEQAIRLLLNQHGGLHVRRAYCTAESAVKHQAAFKRLGIKPMVNLAAGKNSTDIALAVDAIDLVLAERPDVVVIASSDSDFAPLVQRLREKGCVVRGIGQKGKTGDETQDVYDDYTVLEHHKSESTTAARKAPPRKAATRKTAVAKAPAAKKVATKRSPSKKAASAEAAAAAAAAAPAVPAGPAEDAQPAGKPAPRAAAKTAARKTARKAAPTAPMPADVAPAGTPPSPPPADTRIDAVLAVLPELAAGQSLALNVAVQRLREAQLLGRNTPSTKFFAALAERIELRPAGKPTQVLLRR